MHPGSSVVNKRTPTSPSTGEIRAHLGQVLSSPAFRSSKRSCRFLEFIVAETLDGRAGTLKERTLATEVFDRASSWDAGDDTIVRVGAREVRKRLAQYYAAETGAHDNIRIDLPVGSYVPFFVRIDTPTALEPASLTPTVVEVVAPLPEKTLVFRTPVRRSSLWLSLLIGALALAGAFACWRFLVYAPSRPFDVFWRPFFRSSEPVIVAVAHPIVYSPSTRAYRLNSAHAGPPSVASQPLQIPLSALNGSDFVPMPNQFLAFGDAVAANDVQVILAQHQREAHLRFASKVEFADLRESPAIMIGAFSNRWTVELTQHLRFHFGYDAQWVPAILDAEDPRHHWSITGSKDDGSSPEDYFLICRLVTSPSGNPVMIGGGVAQFGTEAAGRFLKGSGRMDEVLRGLRPDWPTHNLELVLHAHIIGNSPAAPDLVASYVW